MPKLRNLRAEDPGIASTLIATHPTQHYALLDERLEVPEPKAIVLLADMKNADELELDKADAVPLFKENNYKINMSDGIMSNILRPKVSIFDIGAGPNLVCSSLLPVKWSDHIWHIHDISLKPASNTPVIVRGKAMLFVEPGDLHVRALSGVVDNLAVPLLVGTLLIDMIVQGMFLIE